MLNRHAFPSRLCGLALCFLAACTPTQPWDRDRQASVTTLFLENASPQEATKLAESVLILADGKDVGFDYRQNGFRASRKYGLYFVIGAVSGNYIFDLTARPVSGGSTVEMKIYVDSTAVTASGVIPTTASLWEQEGAYRLFFSRMLALKDKTRVWNTCKAAPKNLGFASVHFEPLCVAATDRQP